jgi:(1->4)-alpha-D-glucan 1-alpha-D-glucosylmutase
VEKGFVERFHRTMQEYAERPPGLLATATHDTKRGEDARARLYALAERSSVWGDAVARWSAMNAGFRRQIAGSASPEPETEWLLYQSLAGLWPPVVGRSDEVGLTNLAERFLPYVEKALREAKLRTDWLEADEEYENAVRAYAAKLLTAENQKFLDDFYATLQPFIEAGAVNTASQTLAKLTAPGIPDIYQGSEGFDFSLVDPDNRRPVDYEALSAQLDRGIEGIDLGRALLDGTFKQWLIARCLACRRQNNELFATGDYVKLEVSGPRSQHFVAFLRRADERTALVTLQRLPLQLRSATADDGTGQAVIELPDEFSDVVFRNVLTKSEFAAAPRLPLKTVLQTFPVGLALSS